MSEFFDSLFGKFPGFGKRKDEGSQSFEDPTLARTVANIGYEVLSGMSVSDGERPILYDSLLIQDRDMQLGGFSRFVSATEADLFYEVFSQTGREVLYIDAAAGTDLVAMLDAGRDTSAGTPIVIVRNFNQDTMDIADPDWQFDHALRSKVQNDQWVAFLEGSGRFAQSHGWSGSLSGSSSVTSLANI